MSQSTPPSTVDPVPPHLRPPKASWWTVISRAAVWLIILGALGWSYGGAEIDPGKLFSGFGHMREFLSGFLKPDFSEWRYYMKEMVITVQIAIWGTFLAVLLAVPVGLVCSSNIAPWWLRQPMRRLMDAFRAINEIVFALIFISAVGPGPFAGMLALFVHTLGTLAKLFSEAAEAIDPRPVEGVRATGAGAIDEINYAVIPQVMPLWISYTLYRFEANVRSATVLGIVGAGGIGFALNDSIRGFNYSDTAPILIIIVLTVILLDMASAQVRKRFI